jgi:hypothetical protein
MLFGIKKKKTTAVCYSAVPNAICANAKERNSTKKKGGRVVARLFLNVYSTYTTPVRAHKHIGRLIAACCTGGTRFFNQ